MASRIPAGLFLDGRDACVLDAPLRRAVADQARRDGAVPGQLVRLADAVSRTAAEFRTTMLVEPGSGTEEDDTTPTTRVSAVSERLSAQEAARLTGTSAEFVRRLARDGVLQGTKSGHRGAWRLDPGSVAVWVADRSTRRAA